MLPDEEDKCYLRDPADPGITNELRVEPKAGEKDRGSIEEELRKSAEKYIRQKKQTVASNAARALADDQFIPWWQSLRNHLDTVLPQEVALVVFVRKHAPE